MQTIELTEAGARQYLADYYAKCDDTEVLAIGAFADNDAYPVPVLSVAVTVRYPDTRRGGFTVDTQTWDIWVENGPEGQFIYGEF